MTLWKYLIIEYNYNTLSYCAIKIVSDENTFQPVLVVYCRALECEWTYC